MQPIHFDHDPNSRKVLHYFLWLQSGTIFCVFLLIFFQFHSLAVGITVGILILFSALVLWLFLRYRALPVVQEKQKLQQDVLIGQYEIAEAQQAISELKKHRELLFRKEKFALDQTLLNLQLHHIQKGLTAQVIKDAAIPGVDAGHKERLANAGIITAEDISEERLSQTPGFSAAEFSALLSWRSILYSQLDDTKPVNLPDHQLDYIKKKYRNRHYQNDEKERAAFDNHHALESQQNAHLLRLKQLEQLTFVTYLAFTLASKS